MASYTMRVASRGLNTFRYTLRFTHRLHGSAYSGYYDALSDAIYDAHQAFIDGEGVGFTVLRDGEPWLDERTTLMAISDVDDEGPSADGTHRAAAERAAAALEGQRP